MLVTGIGGQGIQLAAQVIARAAIAEGREVQLFGSYGGMMRGGNTEATLVVADGPIESPPTVAAAWSAIVMHHDYSERTFARLRPGSVRARQLLGLRGAPSTASPYVVVDVPATDIAVELGNIMTASMVMVGAYSAVTGLVALDSLVDAVAAVAAVVPRQARRAQPGRAPRRLRRRAADVAPTRGTAWLA